jgi:hypothetical protein
MNQPAPPASTTGATTPWLSMRSSGWCIEGPLSDRVWESTTRWWCDTLSREERNI